MDKLKQIVYTGILMLLCLLMLLCIVITSLVVFIMQPTRKQNSRSSAVVDTERLQTHVRMLAETYAPRDFSRVENLNKCAAYIQHHFQQAGARKTMRQTYPVYGKEYANIRALFGPESSERIVIGAHYDAIEHSPGADDNASGVAGLIELAYLLGKTQLSREIELVAYTLEEPPFFGTQQMGSAHHVESLADEGVDVTFMVALEMIGYFSDQPGSQQYPWPFLRWLYPDRGNFVALVGRWEQRHFVKRFKGYMKGSTDLPVYSMVAPSRMGSVDFSDHRNYWDYHYDALMVTDTAFYRNTKYHSVYDTAERLDYQRMAKVVIGVYEALRGFMDEEGKQ